jgi:hypothetical protein
MVARKTWPVMLVLRLATVVAIPTAQPFAGGEATTVGDGTARGGGGAAPEPATAGGRPESPDNRRTDEQLAPQPGGPGQKRHIKCDASSCQGCVTSAQCEGTREGAQGQCLWNTRQKRCVHVSKFTDGLRAQLQNGEIDPDEYEYHPLIHDHALPDNHVYDDETDGVHDSDGDHGQLDEVVSQDDEATNMGGGKEANRHGTAPCGPTHCDACTWDEECEAVGEGVCMWNRKLKHCFPQKIILFGQEIDMVKLHGMHGEI